MSGHGKGTALFVSTQCSIFRAAVSDHGGIFSGPLDMGLIYNKGTQREQGKDPSQDIFTAETSEKVYLNKIRYKERFQCTAVLAKQSICPCMFAG